MTFKRFALQENLTGETLKASLGYLKQRRSRAKMRRIVYEISLSRALKGILNPSRQSGILQFGTETGLFVAALGPGQSTVLNSPIKPFPIVNLRTNLAHR